MYSCVKSYGINGIDAYAVTVETTLSRSIPSFDVVGPVSYTHLTLPTNSRV